MGLRNMSRPGGTKFLDCSYRLRTFPACCKANKFYPQRIRFLWIIHSTHVFLMGQVYVVCMTTAADILTFSVAIAHAADVTKLSLPVCVMLSLPACVLELS